MPLKYLLYRFFRQTNTVKEETSLQVTMTEDTQKLDEIVVLDTVYRKR